jgi:hypothetical protein
VKSRDWIVCSNGRRRAADGITESIGCSLRHYRLIERNDRLVAYFIKNLHATNPVVFSDDGMLETLRRTMLGSSLPKPPADAFCL